MITLEIKDVITMVGESYLEVFENLRLEGHFTSYEIGETTIQVELSLSSEIAEAFRALQEESPILETKTVFNT